MSERVFHDRREAGRILAASLERYRDDPGVLVLGLPRGGVPVAYEAAMALGAPLDVFLVRKLGVPGHEELAMGALASGGVVVLNDDVLRGLRISSSAVQRAAEQEGRELLRRERAYRDGRPLPEARGRTVLLVDDGLATGASMRAAVQALARLGPARIVVAVPTAPEQAREELEGQADEVVCVVTPSPFIAVGASYWDFTQTTNEEVRELLRTAAAARPSVRAPGPTPQATVRAEALPTEGGAPSDQALFDLVGDARFVLIGEASHGTHEFYAARARMTRRLIEEKGFDAVAVEGDWPDAYRVNRYVRGRGGDADAEEALRGFVRFPTWMWRNTVVLDFVGWLRDHNDRVAAAAAAEGAEGVSAAETGGARARGAGSGGARTAAGGGADGSGGEGGMSGAGGAPPAKVGFYGLDVYSLHRSIDAVIAYLERVDPRAAERARERYACFDHQYREGGAGLWAERGADGAAEGHGARSYGIRAAFGAGDACEREMIDQLVDLRRNAHEYARRDGLLAEDELFDAQQNARSVQDAAEYYRAMFSMEESTWNLRDRHMADTLLALADHIGRTRRSGPAKIVVWAHNSHLGDARATAAGARGELNLGRLMRELAPDECRLIGFSTYTGTVTAADDWGGTAARKRVRPAPDGSVEKLLHEVGLDEFWLPFARTPRSAEVLRTPLLERAIGVIYRPRTERLSHYADARVADQFDALIHIDATRALEPLERTVGWAGGDLPETYPSAV